MQKKHKKRKHFPWVLWILAIVTLAAVYAFWVLPRQLGHREMHIEFVPEER
ncbi:MAG TPA: hypothetical protein VNK96_03175 [Fimbriimonadales bacterium]|nr:hypothetical protein [Fimbriimonadales bacterium]